jgi:hypothetical protein
MSLTPVFELGLYSIVSSPAPQERWHCRALSAHAALALKMWCLTSITAANAVKICCRMTVNLAAAAAKKGVAHWSNAAGVHIPARGLERGIEGRSLTRPAPAQDLCRLALAPDGFNAFAHGRAGH